MPYYTGVCETSGLGYLDDIGEDAGEDTGYGIGEGIGGYYSTDVLRGELRREEREREVTETRSR